MSNKVKTAVAAVTLAVSSTGFAGGHSGCGDVSIGAMGWASAESFAAISSFVLEQGYGCTVSVIPTDTVPAVTSLAENNEPDIVLEVWRNSAPAYPGLVEEGKVITASSMFASGGNEGWWIPQYLVDEHPELATFEGILNNPELVGGRFHNCPVGWGCRLVNDNLKVVHDLEGRGFEVFNHGSGANLGAALAAAYEERQPWFGYYWGPTAVLGKYKMHQVDIGPIDPEVHAENQKENADPDKIGVSGFPAAPVLNAITASFADREPEVAEFVERFSIPNNIISEMLAWKEENNASADETAAYVLQNHKDLILDMVNDSAREKLNALL